MNLFREITRTLDTWFSRPGRRPLLVRGARQVGKSYLIRHWAECRVGPDHVLELNLEEEPRYRAVFDGTLNPDKIIERINFLTGFDLKRGGSLLFIDEIQACPAAITALRYFYEKLPEIPIISAGSLIEFALQYSGVPVGRVEYLYLHPLSFREFLQACGRAGLSDFLGQHELFKPVPEEIHRELLEWLKIYMRVGGMPRAVVAYAESKDYRSVSSEHSLLLQTFQDDFAKYTRHGQLEALEAVFRRLPHFVGLSRVVYSAFDPALRGVKVKQALELLEKARVTTKIISTTARRPPLEACENHKFFKLLFLDIGLLQHALGFDWRSLDLDADLSLVCNGRFAEQYVGQELLANRSGQTLYNLHYWDRPAYGADAEVDYILECGKKIVPVEVKSGFKGSLKGLHQYIKEFAPSLALVVSQRNVEELNSIHWLPLYLTGQIPR